MNTIPQNIIYMVQAVPGAQFSAPPSMFPRGVFDVMGNIEAHIEVNPQLQARCYEIVHAFPGGPAPFLGIYLGHVSGPYGTDIRHLYAVEVSHAG